jgi:hypothetical protein
MRADGRLVFAGLDGGGLPKRDDRVAAARLELRIDHLMVVAHIKHGDLGPEPAVTKGLQQRHGER